MTSPDELDIIVPTEITIIELIRGTLGLLPTLVLLIFLGIIIYGGFTRMTAAGDPEKEKLSSQILTAGIVGFVIVALSPLIINVLGSFLGIDQLLLG
jgi:hypothetical protein